MKGRLTLTVWTQDKDQRLLDDNVRELERITQSGSDAVPGCLAVLTTDGRDITAKSLRLVTRWSHTDDEDDFVPSHNEFHVVGLGDIEIILREDEVKQIKAYW
jgi:hypothetical protein